MLTPGARLGALEVLGPLGAGGMGEVYRARDTRLGRDVAVKILPDAVADDADRLARFEREARLLAALNHPGIAAIHGLEQYNGRPLLVLELVEGPTLAERLRRGPLPMREALEIGRQIAEALEAAHDKGIVHRDLKPSNIKLTPDGRIKLLDFGLAKAIAHVPDAEVSNVSTNTSPTDGGVLLGTAPYMSPEQARGQPVDHQTDVWAFGCVLYEMLTGRRTFPGATAPDVIAALLEREPDWRVLPRDTPVAARALLQRCLSKERERRLHDVADARLEIDEALQRPTRLAGAFRPSIWRRVLWVAAASGTVVVAVWFAPTNAPRTGLVVRHTLGPPHGITLFDEAASLQHLAISPSGDTIVFVGRSSHGRALYIRRLDEVEARLIPGTETADTPFFSPDGNWLGMSQDGEIRKQLLSGGTPVTVATLAGEHLPSVAAVRGATWSADGTIVFTPATQSELWRVSAEGGTPQPVTRLDGARREISHRWPTALPGGNVVVFTVLSPSLSARDARIEALSLASGERRVLVEGAGFARYSPSGHLVYARFGSLFGVRLDVAAMQVAGPAVPLLDDLHMNWSGHLYAPLDIAGTGAIAYFPGTPVARDTSLLLVDHEGNVQRITALRKPFWVPRASPEGHDVLVQADHSYDRSDIWRLDLRRGTWRQLTFDGVSGDPEWSPDGRSIAFVRWGPAGGELLRMPADGGPVQTVRPGAGTGGPFHLNAWSPDGRTFVVQESPHRRSWDLWSLPVAGGASSPLVTGKHPECCAALSPDGRWMAYASMETGRWGIYVRPSSGRGETHIVSTVSGIHPRGSRDGREVYYRSRDERPKIMAVRVDTGGVFRAGTPRPLFDDVFANRLTYFPATYDVLPAGRFVFVEEPPGAPAPRHIVLVPEWRREVERKMRATR